MWTTFGGTPITLEGFIDEHLGDNPILYIGTDSKTLCHTKFSTVLVSYTPGRGGAVAKRSMREPKIRSLQQRLWKEAWYSLELAMYVAELTERRIDIEVHLDVNASDKHKSGAYAQSLVGLVASQGFLYRLKPDAWCASSIADRLVRNS